MRTAVIFAIPANTSQHFAWQWRSSDGKQSSSTFGYYYDCVEDARRAGYSLELLGIIPRGVDGRERQGSA